MAEGRLGMIEGQTRLETTEGLWHFDDDDWALIAMLQDPVYMSELLFEDPKNRDWGGCYRVMDYQYPLFRSTDNYEGRPCARSVGKTESIKARAVCHAFRRQGEDMLISAPELIHLLPLTDAIEARLRDTRLTYEFLDKRNQKTGFTHKPFQVDFVDGTKIVGRIPKLSGPQTLDSLVLTPHGWTTMGDIGAGDEVIGSDGTPIRVLGVTNEWESEVYAVGFTDGSVVKTDAQHLWSVRVDAPASYDLRSTDDLAEMLSGPAKHKGGTLNMCRVPPTPLVQYAAPEDPPPLDPYLVGCLIGDGSLTGNTPYLISADEELVGCVATRLPRPCAIQKVTGKPYAWAIIGCATGDHRNPVMTALRELGMRVKAPMKRVPPRYLYGTPEERLEVLRGILDTDGSAKNGAAHLVTSSRGLAEDVAQLARSLGGWGSWGAETTRKPGTINGHVFAGGTYWRATVRIAGTELFRLSRKRERGRPDARQRHKSVRSVTHIGRALVKCIKVDADDGLYLTDGLTLTHNTGVKGMHVPDLIIDEGQDYPEKGWIEVHECVMKDHVDATGEPDFTYHFYGVHSGARDGRFYKLSTSGEFKITAITAIMRPGWNADEKRRAAAIYGGTQAPDYRRNILGEAGGASSAFFVTSRLMACLDQDRESHYNTVQFKRQSLQAEEVDSMLGPGLGRVERDQAMYDLLGALVDLPELKSQQIYAGADIGLVNDPTVITLWSIEADKSRKTRMKLVRMIHLWRFREKMIRFVMYHIGWKYGGRLRGFGQDVTGLGLPLFQAMEDDEVAPQTLLDVSRGYVFNAKLPIGVDTSMVSKDSQGNLRDAYGNIVETEVDPFTRQERQIVKMTMIEASTRYLREEVDSGFMLLPFEPEIVGDMQGETEQRVRAMAGVRKKPNAFHILDAMRARAMAYKAADIEEQLKVPDHRPVLARAVDATGGGVLAR